MHRHLDLPAATAALAIVCAVGCSTSTPVSTACIAAANELGVGATCSTAADCGATGVCSASLGLDFARDFCTKTCSTDADCGAATTCVQAGSLQTCVPSCLAGDANAASTTTAGTTTGGTTGSTSTSTIPSGAPGSVPATCLNNPNNSYGVGQMCVAGGGSCTRAANTCAADYDTTVPPVCSLACGTDMTDCGPGAVCAQDPKNPNVFACVMAQCAWVGASTTPTAPRAACLPKVNNERGVGKPCASNADCPGANGITQGCTNGLIIKPTAIPYNFCTVGLCTSDAACGTGARCVIAPGMTEKGCVPTSCLP